MKCAKSNKIGEEESDRKKSWENRHPVGHFKKPEEVAAAVLSLASLEASFVTGADLAVDGRYLPQ